MKWYLVLIFLFIATLSYSKTIEVSPGKDTLQSAIDQAEEGDVLILLSGEYISEKAVIISGKKKLTLESEGGGNVWILCENVYDEVIRVSKSSENIIIQNIKAKHVKPLKQYECNGAVISINNSKNIQIKNCELNGCGAMGVSIYQSKDILVTKCYIHQNSWNAFFISRSSNIKITYNKIENNQSLMQMIDVNFLEMWGNNIKKNEGYN